MATTGTSYNVSPNPNDGVNGIVPVGSVMMWAASSPPSDWLICNGTAISRTLYANLFSVIGTTYGVGDGSTTFNIPNLAGRVARGVDGGTYTLAGTGGADSVDLKATDLPYHAHNLTDPGHSHTLNNAAQNNQFFNGLAGTNRQSEIASSLGATDLASTGISVQPSLLDGSGNPVLPGDRTRVDVRDPYLTLNYIIKSF